MALWFVERTSGLRMVAPEWEGLGLDHDDVIKPDRIAALGYRDDRGRQTIVRLRAGETLHLGVRHTIALGGLPIPPVIQLGITREDGSGLFALIDQDGHLTLTSALT